MSLTTYWLEHAWLGTRPQLPPGGTPVEPGGGPRRAPTTRTRSAPPPAAQAPRLDAQGIGYFRAPD
ncbi:hypothetical protein ACFVZX_20895, partial [Streptomyces erythrochromogenes]